MDNKLTIELTTAFNPQINFTQDLRKFITEHPYWKQSEGTYHDESGTEHDRETFDISDPNGDYERVTIRIQYIA